MTESETGTEANDPVAEENKQKIDYPIKRVDQLESLVKEQQAFIHNQRERLASLADDSGPIARREALAAGGILGLLGLGAGAASTYPQDQVGTESNPLHRIYSNEVNSGAGSSLVFYADGMRTCLYRRDSTEEGVSNIQGHPSNEVADSIQGATVGGGGGGDPEFSLPHLVNAHLGTISGGRNNKIDEIIRRLRNEPRALE